MSLSGRWDSLREKRNKHLLERFEQIVNGWIHQWWDSFPWGQLKWRTLFCFPRVPAYWSAGHSSNFRVGDEIFSTLDTISFPIILHWWFSWLFFNSKHLTHFKCLHVWLGTEVKGWTATIISFTDHIFLRLQALILRVFWFWTTTNSTSSPGWSGKKRMILENCLTLVYALKKIYGKKLRT